MGELARMPNAPKLPETPLELITPRPGEGYSPTEKYAWPLVGAITGVGIAGTINYLSKRPLWSGIHRHLIFGAAMSYALSLLRDVKYASKCETDAVIKHYISLHPEDFPPYERKRWSEVYLPFTPYR